MSDTAPKSAIASRVDARGSGDARARPKPADPEWTEWKDVVGAPGAAASAPNAVAALATEPPAVVTGKPKPRQAVRPMAAKGTEPSAVPDDGRELF